MWAHRLPRVVKAAFVYSLILMSIFCWPLFLVIKFNTNLRRKWFSILLPLIQSLYWDKFVDVKKTVLGPLADFKPIDPKRGNVVRVLEIGSGSGANFKYYPKHSRLISVDINEYFEKYFVENKSKFPDIEVEKFVVGSAEEMTDIEDESVDVVIATHVFCCIDRPEAALKEVKRVLLKGGKLFLFEHVGYPRHGALQNIQRLIEPVWKVLADGCHLTRDTQAILDAVGFTSLDIQYLELRGIPVILSPHIFGTATK